MIPDQIVEKAAKAGFENYCNESWEDADPETQAHWTSDTDAALGAVYADIQTEALREAADKWGEGDWQDAFLTAGVCDDVSAVQATVQWLRARAAALDGGKA